MVVGGPNARTDYHWDEGAEWFYQLEGEMVLRIQEDGEARDIPIRAGETFLLPPRVPHSPQRMPDSVGLVIERKRLPHENDGLLWFCEHCNHKLYEEFFTLREHREGFPAGVRPLLSVARREHLQAVRSCESRAGKVHKLKAKPQSIRWPAPKPSPSRGGLGGDGFGPTFRCIEHHPRPSPPLEGEGKSGVAIDGGATSAPHAAQPDPAQSSRRAAARRAAQFPAVVVPLAIGVATGHVGIGLGIRPAR